MFKPNVLMLGLTPSAYVLRAISSVRPSDLEQALLVGVYCSIFLVILMFVTKQLRITYV